MKAFHIFVHRDELPLSHNLKICNAEVAESINSFARKEKCTLKEVVCQYAGTAVNKHGVTISKFELIRCHSKGGRL